MEGSCYPVNIAAMQGSAPANEEANPPASYLDWEHALVRHFLTVGESGDASPIRSFEVTPSTLAEAGGIAGAGAEEQAVESFKRHVCRTGLRDALEHGWYPRLAATDETPGYFAYLCLTLLIASSPDERQLGGDFHQKLRRFLGVTSGFRALPGVAKMWRWLDAWLKDRLVRRLPFRELELPTPPPAWVHIGYTRKLAFPAKSDATLLRTFLSHNPDILERPLAFIRRFEAFLAGSDKASDGMVESFSDFRAARLGGDRFLAEHPFWRLAKFCAEATSAAEGTETKVVCSFDEDGAPLFTTFSMDGERLTQGLTTLSEAVAAMGLGAATRAPTLRRGLLVFQQVGYGRWQSTLGLETAPGAVRLGCSAQAYSSLRDHRSRFAASGSWYFSVEPLARGIADECASLLGVSNIDDAKLSTVSIFGGVRTGGIWLGRPIFLPRIASGADGGMVRPGAGAEGDLTVEVETVGVMRLRSTRPVSGAWFIEPSLGRLWSRRVTFSSDALIHERLGETACQYSPIADWAGSGPGSVEGSRHPRGWDSASGNVDDLVEAVYAGGRSGWDESELIATIQDAFGKQVDPWSMLRVLADAAVIQPRLRSQWKGRVWTLRPPVLRRVGSIALAEGAICEKMAQEFRQACVASNVAAFRQSGVQILAPAVVGCDGHGAARVAERLGWSLVSDATHPEGRLAFKQSSLTLIGRRPASRWDWAARRFIADEREGTGEVTLTRWAQPSGRDHDVYTVESKRDRAHHHLLSRTAAVLLAHSLARIPLFAAEDGFLVGLTAEAHLPDKLAAYLRLRHASNAGILGGLRVYHADSVDLAWLRRLLPAVIDAPADKHRKTGVEAVSIARHSNGKTRLAWRGGVLVAFAPGEIVVGED